MISQRNTQAKALEALVAPTLPEAGLLHKWLCTMDVDCSWLFVNSCLGLLAASAAQAHWLRGPSCSPGRVFSGQALSSASGPVAGGVLSDWLGTCAGASVAPKRAWFIRASTPVMCALLRWA